MLTTLHADQDGIFLTRMNGRFGKKVEERERTFCADSARYFPLHLKMGPLKIAAFLKADALREH